MDTEDTDGFLPLPLFTDKNEEALGLSIAEAPGYKPAGARFTYTDYMASMMEKIYQVHAEVMRLMEEVPPFLVKRIYFYRAVRDFQTNYALAGIALGGQRYTAIEGGQTGKHQYDDAGQFYREMLHGNFPAISGQSVLNSLYESIILPAMPDPWRMEKSRSFPFRDRDTIIYTASSDFINSPSAHHRLAAHHCGTEMIPNNLEKLFQFYSGDSHTPFLIRAAILHFFLGYIHPYPDGNGRLARLAALAMLCSHFGDLTCLGLSSILHAYRKSYYMAYVELERYDTKGLMDYFIHAFLFWVYQTIDRFKEILVGTTDSMIFYNKDMENQLVHAGIPENKIELTRKICKLLLMDSAAGGRGLTMEELTAETGKSVTPVKARLRLLPDGLVKICGSRHPVRYTLTYSKPTETPGG